MVGHLKKALIFKDYIIDLLSHSTEFQLSVIKMTEKAQNRDKLRKYVFDCTKVPDPPDELEYFY